MKTVTLHEAKTHLSHLVEKAAAGNVFIIAKSGKPMAKVTPLSATDFNDSEKQPLFQWFFAISWG